MDDECACYTLTPDLENLAEESLADLGEVLNGMIQVSPSGGDVHAKLSYTAMRDQIEKPVSYTHLTLPTILLV